MLTIEAQIMNHTKSLWTFVKQVSPSKTTTRVLSTTRLLPPLPDVFSRLPSLDILLPTPPPVQKCAALTQAILNQSSSLTHQPTCNPNSIGEKEQHSPMIYAYREDLNSPIAPAGNKLRKLSYVLPHALRIPGMRTLVTVGGVQSNCCRQTAAVAAKLGLNCVVALTHDSETTTTAANQTSNYHRTGNVQLSKLLGADVRMLRSEKGKTAYANQTEEFRDLSQKLELENDPRNFFIPQGASESPSGGVGYARWIFEMLEQEALLRESGTLSGGSQRFDNIVVACATGGTLAGMIAGLRLAERSGWVDPANPRKIIGVETFAEDLATRKSAVFQIARDTAVLLGLRREEIREEDAVLDGRWTAGGYGVYDERTKESIHMAARTEALLLDPVYTGKAMAAVREGILSGELRGNTLFVHTGGHVVLPAYLGIEDK